MDQICKIKLKNYIEQVLHAPGNFTQNTLEMAVVFDASIETERLEKFTKELISTLKQHSDVFKNVRVNTIYWKNSIEFIKEVTPMPLLMLGKYFEAADKVCCKESKSIDELTRQLKLFYARSKLILVISKGDLKIDSIDSVYNSFKPFLGRKLIWIVEDIADDTVLELLSKQSKVLVSDSI